MTIGVSIKNINENISSQTLNLLMDNLNTLSLHITRAINQTDNHILFLDTHARLAMPSSHLPSSPSSLRTSPGLPLPPPPLPPPLPSPPSLSPHPLSPRSPSPPSLSPLLLSPLPLYPQEPGLTRQRALGRISPTIFLPRDFLQDNLDRSPAHPSRVQSPRHSSVSSSTSSSDHEDGGFGFGLKYHKKRSNKRANYTKNYTKRRETRSSKMKKKATKARSLRKPRRRRLL